MDTDATSPFSPAIATDAPEQAQPELRFRLRLTWLDRDRVLGMLALDGVGKSPARKMVAALTANAWLAAIGGSVDGIFYSRDRTHYAARRPFWPKAYTYAAVTQAARHLVDAGLIVEHRTPASPYATRRSRVVATPKLLEQLAELGAGAISAEPRPPIAIRDKAKQDLPLPGSPLIRALAQDVQAQNRFLRRFQIGVSHPRARLDAHGFLVVDGRRLLPTIHYHRVFNLDLDHGGRWFGPWWQTIPKAARAAITIDGEPTVEFDYKCCHPRLLAAWAGLALPFEREDFDFYALRTFDRSWVKFAFNIALNAASRHASEAATRLKLTEAFGAEVGRLAPLMMRALGTQYPELAPFWNTGIGLRLQCLDAGMCAEVQARLRRRNIPCVSVFDSFIVKHSDAPALRLEMDAAMARALSSLRGLRY